MALISTRLHAVGDYAGGALMLAVANLPFVRDRRAAALLRVAGAGTLVAGALTDYELGLWRKIPMRTHLTMDAASGALMTGSALLLRATGAGAGSWIPHAMIGVSEIAGAAVTERAPAQPAAAGAPGASAPVAPAPVQTPEPPVGPPAQSQSGVERVDGALTPDDAGPGDEVFVAQQEAAAAAEAASIGGRVASETGDPAMDPVYQAGEGEQEGYEAAEAELIENATHDVGHGDPLRDALAPEAESDRSGAVYGEADHEKPTEVVRDPAAGEDDPGAGPGLSADRGSDIEPHQD